MTRISKCDYYAYDTYRYRCGQKIKCLNECDASESGLHINHIQIKKYKYWPLS